MFGRRIQLFRVFGFAVNVDPSWFIIALLVTWTLAEGVFASGPLVEELGLQGLPAPVRWTMGVAGALLFFSSIVAHELAHSLVARRYGIRMKGITLFIFGGVAEMTDEPPSARAEFMVAIAGPIASVVIGVTLLALERAPWPATVRAVLYYTGLINLMLVAFNVMPAFPLDGGRVLRSILWAWKNNLKWATRLSSRLGAWFGTGLIMLAVFSVLRGNYVGGVWSFLLGMFLRNAAQMSYRQLLMRQTLEGEPVRRFMEASPRTVPPGISLEEAVEDHVYRHHFKMFPVESDGKLLGCLTTREIRQVPRERWATTAVRDVAVPCSAHNTIGPDADAMQALAKMNQSGSSRLMVVEEGRLVGVISLKDLLRFISLKVELEP